EFIERSFQVLTPTGRFLEIGKGGTWSTERAAQARPHGGYHEYDLSDLLVEEAQGVRAGLAELVDDIDADRAAPLPVSAFAAEAVQSAFRFMAEAGHIGKIVVTHRADAPRIRSDGSYLVTGGLGGLGLEVARWLVEQGARHVTLAGRSAASPEAAERIVAMEAAGATVRVVQGDVADAGDVRRIVDASVASGVPLRGVFHAAGVVDDGVLEQQTSQRFAAVFAPKVLGAAHLDEATRDADLDHFVLFSSASALLGAPGQSNYAAANSALDAVAARRLALGLPALSLNWGAWGEVGMAARLPSRERQRLADRGIGLLSTSMALDALGQLMDHDAANVAVLDVDWPLLAAHAGDAGPPALLHELTAGPRIDQSRSAGAGPGLLASLAEAEPHARHALVVAHVHEHVARVLGLAADEVLDHDDELAALGLDSLMAVELTNRLRSATGLTLSTTVAFDHPSISALADHLAEALGHLPASGEHVSSHHSEHGPVAVGRDRALPASSAQYRLLFVDQFAAGLAIYNLPMVLRIRGAVDADAVRFAVDSLVRRHEALRTNFAFVDGGWVQQIVAPDAASVPFTIEEGGGDPDAFAIRLRTEGARPFDLAADVKMRSVLFSMSPDEHVLALTFHHIAADGWSVTRLIVEFAELYSAAVEDRTPQLAELPLQYADWSVWQHAVEDESLYEHKLAYWTDVLGGTLPVLDLPTDHRRPAIQTYRSDRVVVDLPPELLSGVRSAARAAGVTPFVFLLAGYLATLARWSGQDDIVVGTASANRAWPETHDVVGLFANIVAIRAGVDLDQPFATLLETVKSASLGAFRHADVPFDRIVEALNPPRDLSRSMIFQTTFVLNNMPIPDVAIAGLDIEVEEVSAGATDNDLACWVTEQGDRAEVAVEYNADVFDSETVLRLFDHWQRLLASAAADPMSPAGVLTMIAPAERELVQREWAGRPASDVPQVP
ncbi:MAG: SDR family NAD(P)-dependent oxidoreductase, partial [Ilumatobacteraceae bacterium]